MTICIPLDAEGIGFSGRVQDITPITEGFGLHVARGYNSSGHARIAAISFSISFMQHELVSMTVYARSPNHVNDVTLDEYRRLDNILNETHAIDMCNALLKYALRELQHPNVISSWLHAAFDQGQAEGRKELQRQIRATLDIKD